MGEQRLRALAVRLAAVDAAAARHADRDRRGEVARRAVAQPRRLGDDLVRGRVEVVGELDLDHRPQAVGRHADRRADDAAFGDRRIEHALLAVLGLQAFGAAEHAAEVADVLADRRRRCRRARASRPSPSAGPGSWSCVGHGTQRSLLAAACRICSLQVRRHVLVDVLEHRRQRRDVAVEQRAVASRPPSAPRPPRRRAPSRLPRARRPTRRRGRSGAASAARSGRRAGSAASRRRAGSATGRPRSSARRRGR